MRKTALKRRIIIVSFLFTLCLCAWYGGNWFAAGRLDPIPLTEFGDEDSVIWMMKWRPDVVFEKSQAASPARNLLKVASASGRAFVVRKLLLLGKDPNWYDPLTRETALHYAAVNGHCSVVRTLIRGGAEVNSVCRDGESPFDYAILSSHLDAAELLLRAGGKTTSKRVMAEAITAADAARVDLLLRGDAEPESPDKHQNTLLHYTCRSLRYGSAKAARMLIRNGARPNALNAMATHRWTLC